MSRYYSNTQKSRRERIGFYTALAICLVAVCMAVYSTYSTVTDVKKTSVVSTTETKVAVVNQPVTQVTVPVPTFKSSALVESSAADEVEETATEAMTSPAATDAPDSGDTERGDALETMLAADVSLSMPTKTGHVLREYSKESVYNKVLNTWKPHTGIDFDGSLGDDVYAMLGGEVTKVTEDKMYGKTAEVTVNNVIVGYSGLGNVNVKQGDKLERGDKIGTIGVVPVESDDKNHIHVYVRVNNTYADPLSFIGADNVAASDNS